MKKKRTNPLFYFIHSPQLSYLLFFEIVVGLLVTIGSFILFVKIRDSILEKEFYAFDTYLLHYFYMLRNPLLNMIMIGISYFGDQIVIASSFFIILLLLIKKLWKESFLYFFLLSMGFVLDVILKNFFQRVRPQFHPLVLETDYSFPSGHAMMSLIFYVTLCYFVYHFTKNTRYTLMSVFFAILIILSIGISRIYLGVHFPSDIIGGYFSGLFWFASIFFIDKTVVFFRYIQEKK